MAFKAGDRISHKFYGTGKVVRVRKEWYEVEFKGAVKRNILKGHLSLKPKGYKWSPEDIKQIEAFTRKYDRVIEELKGGRHPWCNYEDEL